MFILPEKELNTLLLFIVNLGHDEVKISKHHTLAYFTPAKYDNLSDDQENNQAGKLSNISITTSETNAEKLPPIPSASKMIFQVITHLSGKCYFKMKKTSADTKEKSNSLIHAFKDIMSSSSNNIGYTPLTGMDIENDPYLPPVATKAYKLPHKEWVRKELKDWEKAGIIPRCLALMHHLL